MLASSFVATTAAYTRRDFTVDYLFKFYNEENAAFSLKIGDSPSIKATYYAISALEKILSEKEFEEKVNVTTLSTWIKNKQVSNTNASDFGAFRDADDTFGTIYTTLFAIQLLTNINKIDEINKTNLINWLNACYNEDGSFSVKPSSESSLSTTYAGIIILSKINEIDAVVNKTRTINWILKLQITNTTNSDYGSFAMYPNATKGSVVATFMALEALNILGAKNMVNLTNIKNWIKSIYSNNGYFFENKESMSINEHNIYTTYYGIKILKMLESITDEQRQQLTKWILDLQCDNGGFAYNEDLKDSNIISTSLALLALHQLNSLEELNEKAPWIWGGYTFLEVIGFTILAVIIISVAGYYSYLKYRK